MSQKTGLFRIRRWPRWIIIPIGLGLAGLAVVFGLLLQPAAESLSPERVEPTPTVPTVAYREGTSENCHDCHFALPALQASAADSGTAVAYLIEEESVATTHGTLGCLTCHGGDGEATDKESAHQDIVADMSAQDPEKCVICHQELPDEIPGHRLRVPHSEILARIEEGTPCDVHCSDCHGGVGHGFDPMSGETSCSMTVCLDCHQERKLDIQMADCDACHIGPHDETASLTCSDCHSSTEVWQEVDQGDHPMELSGKHGETACFQCHQYPNFEGLNNLCADCHTAGHDDYGSQDCASCHDSGDTWEMVGNVWEGHVDLWDQYTGEHLKVACAGCHFEGFSGVDPNCTTCHKTPDSHADERAEIACENCHQADQPWGE